MVKVMIFPGLCDLIDQTKPSQFDRQTWVNTLLDIAIRIKIFSDSPEQPTTNSLPVEFPSSLGNALLSENSRVIYFSKKRLKEENGNTTTINNYYSDSSNIEGSYTADQKQKKEADKTLEDIAVDVLAELRLEELNRPLNERALELVARIKEQTGKNRKDEFEAFWKLYQSCPAPDLRVNAQSKGKAHEQYRLKMKETSHQSLLEAAEKAISHQMECQRRHEWVPALPDAYRWLRDDKWAVWLDQIEERQQKKGDWA